MAAEITATTLHHGLPFGFSRGQFSGKGPLTIQILTGIVQEFSGNKHFVMCILTGID